MTSKTDDINKNITHIINKEHLTHYKKIKLNDDISLRYFYSYEDMN